MSLWSRNPYEDTADEFDDFSNTPSGGPIKMWLLGVGLPLIPLVYGIRCLRRGEARFFGDNGNFLDLTSTPAISLAIAYVAVGLFIHAHWFWGLHPRLYPFSPHLKGFALVVFVVSFFYTMYRIMLGWA